jgi:hypothetical protein
MDVAPLWRGRGKVVGMALADLLTERAMALALDTFDDQAAVAELLDLAHGDKEALDRAIEVCLAQPTSLATRQRAIELLANALYGEPAVGPGDP